MTTAILRQNHIITTKLMKRLLLTIILLCAVMVASGACTSAKASSRPNMRKTIKNREGETFGEVQNVYRVQMRTAEKNDT